MAKKNGKKKTKVGNGPSASSASMDGGGDSNGIMVDPAMVRYQHARIRPFFSGCGRRVEDTLNEIRQGKIKPSDLPPIQVLRGPTIDETTGESWYFSLNNRRLWVLKRCREEGLLQNNKIYVRIRKAKSEQEALRYSIENCVLEAKFMPEKSSRENIDTLDKDEAEKVELNQGNELSSLKTNSDKSPKQDKAKDKFLEILNTQSSSDKERETEEDDDSDDEEQRPPNRFSALF